MIRPASRLAPHARAPLLFVLLGAFVLRVTGQLLVVTTHPAWLPAMGEWYSGLLPYPLLLPAQLVLIVVMLSLARRVERGGGRLTSSDARMRWLTGTSYLYAASMVVRYVVQMTMHPEWRWLGHTIPVVFHLVLATFLFVLAGAWRTDLSSGTNEGRERVSGSIVSAPRADPVQ